MGKDVFIAQINKHKDRWDGERGREGGREEERKKERKGENQEGGKV